MTSIGIDLGTTNSAVAVYERAREVAKVLANADGKALTPSVVGMRERNGQRSILVGHSALNWAKKEPRDTILSVKRLMGRDFADKEVEQARSRMSYQIVAGEGSDPRAHVLIGGEKYAPAQVSTLILSQLKADAGRVLGAGKEPTHAVITVPAYFKEAQRAATREAGEQAGLVVKRIIDEPTAAAIAFGLEQQAGEQRRVLVYDLGGGTFDISVLNTVRGDDGRNHLQVLTFSGDNWLGGDDFDLRIVDLIINWVQEHAGVDPSGDLGFLFNAKKHAEQAKQQLSKDDEVDIIIEAATRGAGGAIVDVDMTLSRAEFERLIEPLVTRTIELVRKVLDEQNLSPDDISDVLLVGGSTLTPKVYQAVEAFFGKTKVRRNINPMECVALGAGILAETLSGVQCASCDTVNDESASDCTECGKSLANARPTGDTEIYDVTGQALGIAAVKGNQKDVFVPIIARSTPYPLSEPMRLTFEATDGRKILVPVYEGDDPVASRNYEQGVIEYELEQEIDRNTRVEVAFNFDRDRILDVTIAVPGTTMQHNVKLRTDAPRTAAPQAAIAADDDGAETAREDLLVVEEAARVLLRDYEEYMDPTQANKLRSDLEQAQQVLVFSDPVECGRMISKLEADIFGSGLASQLYLADRVAEQAAPEEAREINAASAAVQRAFRQGRRDMLHEQQQVLKAMVASVRKRDVAEIGDAEAFDGLLRTLDRP